MEVRRYDVFDNEGKTPKQLEQERAIRVLTAMGIIPPEPQLRGAEREAELQRRIESVERATRKRIEAGNPVEGWDLGRTPEQRARTIQHLFEEEERGKVSAPILFRQMLEAIRPYYKGLSKTSREFLLTHEQQEMNRRSPRQRRER